MNLREYYGKIRELAKSLSGDYVVVVSKNTADGGKAGVFGEVSREDAARLIVEGRADLASEEQSAAFREQVRSASLAAEDEALRNQIQVKIVADSDWRALRDANKSSKG